MAQIVVLGLACGRPDYAELSNTKEKLCLRRGRYLKTLDLGRILGGPELRMMMMVLTLPTHVRTCTVAISDGAVPDKIGRGYVVRRILRRGVRYAKKYFGDISSEVREKEKSSRRSSTKRNRHFALTLDRGEAVFGKYVQKCRQGNTNSLSGEYTWRLYDTYGFPVDLTKLMAEEESLHVNGNEVAAAQEKTRKASKRDKKSSSDIVALDVHDIAALKRMAGVQKTDDTFVQSTSEMPDGAQFGVILDKTNFYAGSGGQVDGTGRLIVDGVAEVDVRNVQSYCYTLGI
ncbi:tRNA synthetases class II (A)-domain-containing protein [Aspergillus undulatus]|uniref:tRNA synthetases class II (A)-domain-containing protein n=1 Tax=Aspergillus undulatus TaxID=1810928 RepID=UPI003CCD5578